MASTTEEMLDDLWARGRIAIARGAIFSAVPLPLDLEDLRRHERIEGMLLGLAVGDALGHSTEWRYDADARHREFGTIVDHIATEHSLAGRISDDTQFSLWTLECLLARREFVYEDVVRSFVEHRTHGVGMGRNTSQALARHAERMQTGQPAPEDCIGDSQLVGRGNGTVMRLAPLLLPHLQQPSPRLYADLALAAFITHGHPAALAATVALGHLLWECLRRPHGDAPEPQWWLDEFIRVARDLERRPANYLPCPEPVPKFLQRYEGNLFDFLDTHVRSAWRRRMSVRDACSLAGFGSGADCMQSVPAILYILMHHADSLESAVIAAVNDTKDNDTIASVVGAFTGALHGRRVIRRRWLNGISSHSLWLGKGDASDLAALERLTREARRQFVDGRPRSVPQAKWLF